MKGLRYNVWFWWMAGVLFLLSFNTCIYDHYDAEPELISEGDGSVLLQIDYGMEQGEGLLIETLDILSFYVVGETELFLYRSPEVTLVDDNGSSKYYEARLGIYNNIKQRLVLIANAGDELDALGEISFRTPKEDILPLLEFAFIPRAIEDPDDENTPVYLPMWGESGEVSISRGVNALTDAISLIRSVMRLDVTVNSRVRNDFKLKEVYLYNPDRTGCVVPDVAVYDATDKRVTGATLPKVVNRDLSYPSSITTTSSDGINTDAKFYMVENAPVMSLSADLLGANPSVTAIDSTTCLIIGGEFNGEGKTTYYRIDFRSDDLRSFRSLLRNYHYTVDITSVLSSGYGTPGEAFKNTWKDIANNQIEWNLEEIGWEDLHTDSWLKVSPTLFYFMKDDINRSGTFAIETDYDNFLGNYNDDGWQGKLYYGSITDTDWITFDHNGSTTWQEVGDPEVEYTYSFTVDEYTGIPWRRHAWIEVKAGNLIKYIDFYQTHEVWTGGSTGDIYDWAEITPSDIEIDGPYRLGVSETSIEVLKENNTYSFDISTSYKYGYTAESEVITGEPDWLTITGGKTLNGPGDQELKFEIKHNTTPYDREGVIIITAGKLIKKVYMRQTTWIGDGDGTSMEMDWSESDPLDHEPDGFYEPYRLGVSQTMFELVKGDYTNSFAISTDFKYGYESWIETSDGDDTWVTISSGGSALAPTNTTLSFTVSHNIDDETRHATIYIKAGGLVKEIHLRQLTVDEEEIYTDGNIGVDNTDWDEADLSKNELDGVLDPYRLAVNQTMFELTKGNFSKSIDISTDYRYGYSSWVKTSDSDDTWVQINSGGTSPVATNGTLSFTVYNDTEDKTRHATIYVKAGTLVKEVHIRPSDDTTAGEVQIETGYPDTESSYITNQLKRQYFLVRSRTAWEVEVVGDPEDDGCILRTLQTTGGSANWDSIEEEQKVWFVLKTIESGGPYEQKFRIKSVTGTYLPVEVVIKAAP